VINWLKLARFCCRQLAKQDADSSFYALKDLARQLTPDYRFKWPQMDWWRDEAFNQYLTRFDEANGMNCDRRWMLHQLLRLVDNVPGDTAECGVFAGSSSYVICQANQTASCQGKRHHMFDSFEGLSKPNEDDGAHWTQGDLVYGLRKVQQNLRDFELTAYYPGWIPARFSDVNDINFSFLHIDVDLYEPTRDSFAGFYSRVVDGGIILVDDYGFTTCPGATQAVDEFLADKPEQMLRLSGGGGFIIKGIRTSAASPMAAAA